MNEKLFIPISYNLVVEYSYSHKSIANYQCSQVREDTNQGGGRYELLFTKRYGKITYSRARVSPLVKKLKKQRSTSGHGVLHWRSALTRNMGKGEVVPDE